ncbi:MAG: UDPGP type 1 family protein [Planctomycetes bacterium]|nr:UDPGP type 1 family protein [Planctomycetota bacterium]
MNARFEHERERARRAGQEHVLRFWRELDEPARARLLAQVERLDYDEVSRLGGLMRARASERVPDLQAPVVVDPRRSMEPGVLERARAAGRALLGQGRVGFVLVAGGQASRLGYDGPKGMFPVMPLSGRTLFEVHARRLLAVSRRHDVRVPWYVMTSPANDAQTRAFFAERAHFGLDPQDVVFFSQDTLPALDDEGRILLAARDQIFLAPNGHGGLLLALASSGALADMRRRGLETISYFQVDNPLALPADELFLGLHAEQGAQMSSKVVSKRSAAEKVGVLGRIDGRMGCIEYSDLPAELRERRDETGRLVFDAGNIALHALDVGFVEQLTRGGLRLPWHLARKKMTVLDEVGQPVERWGTKFEAFVFDALGEARSTVTLSVDRASEFSPVKNREGEDSPASTRRNLCALHADWAHRAGRKTPPAEPGTPARVEIDPLLAQSAEEFAALGPLHPREVDGGHLYERV